MKKPFCAVMALILATVLVLPVCAAEPEHFSVKALSDNIVIDGSILSGEWGDPVFSVTPDSCLSNQSKGWDYWAFVPAPADQSVKLYLSSDTEYVYIAAQLVGADADFGCTDPGQIYKHPHFGFTLTKYSPGTFSPVIEFEGQQYEQYSYYCLGLINGEKWTTCLTQGMDMNELGDENFSIAYDEAARTYTYECRVPYEYTNITYPDVSMVTMGLDMTDAQKGESGNRYLVSCAAEQAMKWMGPYNFAHGRSNPPLFDLSGGANERNERFFPTEEELAAAKRRDAGTLRTKEDAKGQTGAGTEAETAVNLREWAAVACIAATVSSSVMMISAAAAVAGKRRNDKNN